MTCELKLIKLLRDEMVLALGCTEPIAIAYAAALVTQHLGQVPERLLAQCSANMIKNVKSVIVPNSGGMKGIEAACLVGAYFGDADKKLEVLSAVSPSQAKTCQSLLEKHLCEVKLLESTSTLHIIITGYAQENSVSVEIRDNHTQVVKVIKNGEVLQTQTAAPAQLVEASLLDNIAIDEIIAFARQADYSPIVDLLDKAIACNTQISAEGLKNPYGVNVGKVIMMTSEDSLKNRAKAVTAAASDARMSGCDLPVMINSGSGNQGLTVSLPIITYARALDCSQEQLYRALILSNLIALYEKSYIGKLSAYCGVVCAASGSAAGITLLKGGTDSQIEAAVINTLGTLSGMICDGAKASCASKIATCVDTAITCHEMAMLDNVLSAGDGIIKYDLAKTIQMVGRLANQGMQTTDKEILKIMLDK
ncbi:L-serine ammonia-lyase, iron-sulfur-dependent, subunit alpha [Utexia brackfieldae]|uniref:L-cysteine desulfidase family protein n=1 Tax=Utexia brackfieldae TaxID=3074108 RepID=UPI00370DB4E2